MKPHVVVHMTASIDGRTLPSRWSPKRESSTSHYERIHEKLEGDAWLVGRTTGQEFAKATSYSALTAEKFPRQAWITKKGAGAYGIVLDPHGKIAWGRADIGGDPIVVVLTEKVSDSHLAGLRADGVSYLFAGKNDLDEVAALETIGRELGVKRLLLEGGGVTNGTLLRAGLVDEISVLVSPVVDGAPGAPALFDAVREDDGKTTKVKDIALTSSETLDGGVVWLRYAVTT